jgi:hypothetical protein
MATHCHPLILSYGSIAPDDELLAANHRKMADQAERTS